MVIFHTEHSQHPFKKLSSGDLPEIFTKITQNTLHLFGNLPINKFMVTNNKSLKIVAILTIH